MSDSPTEDKKEEQITEEITETKEADDDETEKPKSTRRTTRFVSTSLLDPEKGLKSLYEKVKNFDPESYPSKKEAFHNLMERYRRWAYRLYPSEFNDACMKIANTSGTRTIIKDFIYEANGGEPFIYDEYNPNGVKYFNDNEDSEGGDYKEEPKKEDEDEEKLEEAPAEKKAPVDFIDSDDDSDSMESQNIPEILDLFASQQE